MDDVLAWCGFLGTWLLVAGPVYQAMLELGAEEDELERLSRLMDDTPPPPPTSAWWWLLPPVHVYRERRRRRAFRQRVIDRMTEDELVSYGRFLKVAAGWLFVAIGGFLLAAKETDALLDHLGWSSWLWWLVVPVTATLCAAVAHAKVHRDARETARRRGFAS